MTLNLWIPGLLQAILDSSDNMLKIFYIQGFSCYQKLVYSEESLSYYVYRKIRPKCLPFLYPKSFSPHLRPSRERMDSEMPSSSYYYIFCTWTSFTEAMFLKLNILLLLTFIICWKLLHFILTRNHIFLL